MASPNQPNANIQTISSFTFQTLMTYHHCLLLHDYLAAKTIPQSFQPILDRLIYHICPPFPFSKLNRVCQNYPTKSPSMQHSPIYPNPKTTPTNTPLHPDLLYSVTPTHIPCHDLHPPTTHANHPPYPGCCYNTILPFWKLCFWTGILPRNTQP